MTMEPAGTGRLVLSLTGIVLLAMLVWRTMEPGRFQQLTWLLLGFFAVRVILGHMRAGSARARAAGSRKMDEEES